MRNDTLKVLLVSPLPPPPGGIATWTDILLRQVSKSPDLVLSHVDTAVRWKPIVNTSLSLRLIGGSLQACWDIVRVAGALVRFRPDVVHLTTSAQIGLLKDAIHLLLARICRSRGILHIHDPQLTKNKRRGIKMLITWLTIRLAARVIAADRQTYDLLLKQMDERRLARIPNMIALEDLDRVIAQTSSAAARGDDDGVELVFVGRVTKEKGVNELVEACVAFDGVSLHLMGPIDAVVRAELEKVAIGRESGAWLHFHGFVDRQSVFRQILKSDVFVLPSRSEAFPMSILEGMALSKPIIATDVGSIREVIGANGADPCGVCTKAGDVRALRAGLEHLLQHPEERLTLGRNGRCRIETLYSSDVVMKQLLTHWR